jgi:3-deoxy-D-manno-octulosonic-acid transferase
VNPVLALGYEAAGQLARGLAAIAPEREGKLWQSLRARRGIRARYAAWGRSGREPTRPLLWMHAPSVGEGLQARPVLERVRASRPDAQLAYTHFSPSAASFARGLDVDFRDFLPFDTAGDADAALDALRPSALVFSKLDVWPTLARRARARGVRLGLVSATLAPSSSRRSGVAGALLREAYGALDLVGAIDEADAARLVALGVAGARVRVTGDTRYDQVWARAAAVDRTGALLAPLRSPRPTLVAGSTWPADEGVLLDAWRSVRARLPEARLVVAPHEPTPGHLDPIERWAGASGLRLARLGAPTQGAADVILVDRVGVLGDLYALADVALVGGGFHDAGLHSVLEPAAFGAPVLVGPRHGGSRDAGLLLAAGAARATSSSGELAAALAGWLAGAEARHAAGGAARAVVERGLGAAERSTGLVLELLDGAPAGRG